MDDAAADVAKRLFIPTFSLLLDGHPRRSIRPTLSLPLAPRRINPCVSQTPAQTAACALREDPRKIISAKINSSKYPPPVAFWAHGQLEFSPQAQLVPDQSNIYPRLFTSVLIKLISASDGHVFMARY